MANCQFGCAFYCSAYLSFLIFTEFVLRNKGHKRDEDTFTIQFQISGIKYVICTIIKS